MAYTVLARRYRSQKFEGVVGQQPVAETLRNAISSGRVAHAYLFCGTRGVGKTSMARLFARALNAPDTVEDAPRAEDAEYPPQDVQERMAEAIMSGQDMNVVEIDGASNNSVDNARQLISNAGLSPTANALHKIYIIDEVHMLSGAAFNALLKTMEEPPPHVKFILCTTEPHKVPATIQSRCQRFEFRNIPAHQIADHLRDVLDGESVTAEDEVLWQVARLGRGSMRDALSLMDRLLATGQDPLTAKVLEEMLGLPDHTLIARLVDGFADGDLGAALERTADLLGRGVGQDQLTEVLIERLRQLMLIAACGADSDLLELSEDAKPDAVRQAERFDAAGLVHMIALLENLQRAAKSSPTPRALLDATVVRLALTEKLADVAGLLAAGTGPGKKKSLTGGDTNPRTAAPASLPTPRSAAPTAAPPAPPPPRKVQVDASDPAAAWAEVVAALETSNAWAWLDQVEFAGGGEDEHGRLGLAIRPKPAAAGIATVAHADRLDRLAAQATTVLGHRVRVTLEMPQRPDHAPADEPGAPHPAAGSLGSRVAAEAAEANAERQKAMGQPLVRAVLSVFPDAVLVKASKKKPAAEPSEADEEPSA